MKIKVLVIGAGMYVCGRGTSGYGTVIPALAQAFRDGIIGEIYLAATSEKSIARAKEKIRQVEKTMELKLPIKYYPEKGKNNFAYREAIAQNPDCAILAVPDHLHYPIASRLIKAGIHVLSVKPLTPTLAQAEKLVMLADNHSVLGMVEFHKRQDEANLKLKQCCREGKLGDILYVAVEFSQRRNVPEKIFRLWAEKTNIFQYLGVHYIDLIYFATGATPLRVLAVGQKNLLSGKGINTYDSMQVFTQWRTPGSAGTFISVVMVNWVDPETTSAMSDQRIKVIGTKGRYESDQKDRGVRIVTQDAGIEDFNPYFSQFYPGIDGKMVFRGYGEKSIRQFIDDVKSVSENGANSSSLRGLRPTFRDSLVSTAVIESATKSLSRNGAWISI